MKKKLGWLLIVLAILLPRWPTLCKSLWAIDESIYAVFGNEILHGALPYRDLVDYKPPLIFYLYALAFALGGASNMFVVHLFHIAIVAGTCAALYLLGRRLKNEKTGFFAAFFYGLFSAAWVSKHSLATNAEPLMVFPLSLAALLYLNAKTRPSWWRDLLCGFCLGVAFLTKYTSGINLALTLSFLVGVDLFLPFFFRKAASKDLLGAILKASNRASVVGVGFLTPIALLVMYYVHKNALWDLKFWGWEYNHLYISQGAGYITWDYFFLKFIARTLFFASGSLLIWILAGRTLLGTINQWLLAFKTRAYPKSSDILFVIAWLLISFVPVAMGGRLFYHYYVQLIPPLALLAALSAPDVWKSSKGKVAIVVLSLIPFLIFQGEAVSHLQEKNSTAEKIAQHIVRNSLPQDRLFIWGYLPSVHFYAARAPASRFVFSQFLTGSTPKTNGMDFDPKHPELRPGAWERVKLEFSLKPDPLRKYDTSEGVVPIAWELLMKDLAQTQPLFILDTAPANIDRYGNYPIAQYPPLQKYIDEYYASDTVIDNVIVYRRRLKTGP